MVTVSTAGTLNVAVYIGTGADTDPDEIYTGVCTPTAIVSPCSPTLTVDVCGSQGPNATFRRLQIDNNFLPVVLSGGALLQTFTPPTGFAVTGTSIAASSALGLVFIGVLQYVTSTPSVLHPKNNWQSSIWTLQSSGTPVPAGTTGFNSASTGFLQMTVETLGCSVLDIIITPQERGHIYVVGAGYTDPTNPLLPATTVLVWSFFCDTNPDMSFGMSGITQWYGNPYGSAIPQAAVLDSTNTYLLITGDFFASETNVTDTNVFIYNFQDMFWRSVYVTQIVNTQLSVPPTLFLIKVTCDGGAFPLLIGAPGCPCSSLLFSSTLVCTSLGIVQLLGDWSTDPVGIDQPAGVLNLVLRGGNVQNCAQVATPVLQTACDGVVTIDARACALPTTLIVNGPIVPGNTSGITGPTGAIRFNPVTNQFEGFTGLRWIPFAMVPE